MTNSSDNRNLPSAELLRVMLGRVKDLSAAPAEQRASERWAYEAAGVGDFGVLATLALLSH